MQRLFLILGILIATGAVVAAGRYWSPPLEDWTAAPLPAWRGLDGAGYTLALPTDFRHEQEDTRQGEQELVVRPPQGEFTSLRVFALMDDAPRQGLREFLHARLGLSEPGRACAARIGPLTGSGETGTLPSGNRWKAAALDARSLPGSRRLRTLIVAYDQVPPAQQPVFDRILGSVRLLPEENAR